LTLDTGHWTLDTGHWTLDTGHWTLDTGEFGTLNLTDFISVYLDAHDYWKEKKTYQEGFSF